MIDGIPIWHAIILHRVLGTRFFLWHKKSTFRCFAPKVHASILPTKLVDSRGRGLLHKSNCPIHMAYLSPAKVQQKFELTNKVL